VSVEVREKRKSGILGKMGSFSKTLEKYSTREK